MLQATADRTPSFDRTRHRLPRYQVLVPRDQARVAIGACHAVVTITSRDLREAITIREMARHTRVTVPRQLDSRQWRYASTRWMQPRSDRGMRDTGLDAYD